MTAVCKSCGGDQIQFVPVTQKNTTIKAVCFSCKFNVYVLCFLRMLCCFGVINNEIKNK